MLFFILLCTMKKPFPAILFITLFFFGKLSAQTDVVPYVKDAIRENLNQQYRNILKNIINKNLSRPLADSTEEYWQDAFYALELTNYKSLWVDDRIRLAFDVVQKRSIIFQRALLELAYSNYKGKFVKTVDSLMQKTKDPKVFAMAAEYYIAAGTDPKAWDRVVGYFSKRSDKDDNVAFYYGLLTGLITGYSEKKDLPSFVNNVTKLIPGHILLISFQRKNRNYPGIAIIRDASGNFISDEAGNVFSVPQLARSINNLPFYLTRGNTPQGIFRMRGFDVSKSMAIGPTTNIQLLMPYETSPQFFLNDYNVGDSAWTEEQYRQLLPESLKEYLPLYESFYASKAGRTEIIAHGTTVNTEYYKGLPWYPYTPTEGCLCTKEIWSPVDGKRMESDQQKLVDALRSAGGAIGYCVVVELDNQQQPVTLQEVMTYVKAVREK